MKKTYNDVLDIIYSDRQMKEVSKTFEHHGSILMDLLMKYYYREIQKDKKINSEECLKQAKVIAANDMQIIIDNITLIK